MVHGFRGASIVVVIEYFRNEGNNYWQSDPVIIIHGRKYCLQVSNTFDSKVMFQLKKRYDWATV